MIDFLAEWARAVWTIVCESGPYLLFGFTLAGLMKALVPQEKVFRHLGKDDFRSVFIASAVGVPIPLCSCSVLPAAMQLRKSGASKGATTSFMISTPETGVDSIGITWALLDPLMTITRPIAAMFTALMTGSLVNVLVRRGWDRRPGESDVPAPEAAPTPSDSCSDACHDHGPEYGHSHEPAPAASGNAFVRPIKQAFLYGFGPLLADLTPWFIVGFVLSGLITVLFPADLLTRIPEQWSWLTMVGMLAIAMPLYVCATASTPVAAALIAKGLDPGAALVLLLAGPATSVATMLVVRRFLGARVLVVYLGTIAAFSLALGFLINAIYAVFELDIARTIADNLSTGPGPVSIAAGVVLAVALLVTAWRIDFAAWCGRRARTLCRPLGFDPTTRLGKALVAAAALALWASTGLSSVAPGEAGFVMRFGRVEREVAASGLVMHLPFPFERVQTVAVDEVRTAEFGFDREGSRPLDRFASVAPRQDQRSAEAEMICGDENLMTIRYAVQYRVSDPRRFLFGSQDPEAALRACAESAMRRMIGRRRSAETVVESREDMQAETLALLQRELDAVGAGIDATDVLFLYVHAPQQVHFSYLDVANAIEDKERRILKGKSYEVRTLAEARAAANAVRSRAEGEALLARETASGQAAAFRAVASAFRSNAEALVKDVCDAFVRTAARTDLVVLFSDTIELVLSRNDGPGAGGAAPAATPQPAEQPPTTPQWDDDR